MFTTVYFIIISEGTPSTYKKVLTRKQCTACLYMFCLPQVLIAPFSPVLHLIWWCFVPHGSRNSRLCHICLPYTWVCCRLRHLDLCKQTVCDVCTKLKSLDTVHKNTKLDCSLLCRNSKYGEGLRPLASC